MAATERKWADMGHGFKKLASAAAIGMTLLGCSATSLAQSARLAPFIERVEGGADATNVRPGRTHFAYDVVLDPGSQGTVTAGTLYVNVVGPGRLWHATDQAMGLNGVLTSPQWTSAVGSSLAYDTFIGGLRDGPNACMWDTRILGSAVVSPTRIHESGKPHSPVHWRSETATPGEPVSAARLTFAPNPGYLLNLEGRGEPFAIVLASFEISGGRRTIEFPMTIYAESAQSRSRGLPPDVCEPGITEVLLNERVTGEVTADYLPTSPPLDSDMACSTIALVAPDAWYRFTPPVDGTYRLDSSMSTGIISISVERSCMGPQVACKPGPQTILLNLEGGVEYFIRILRNTLNPLASGAFDFIITPFGTLAIGDRVFVDTNNNGLFDVGTEVGIDGVIMELRPDDGDLAFNASNDVVTLMTVTQGGGFYAFTGLQPGNYWVTLAASNFLPGGVLQGFTSSTGPGVSANPNDGIDNDDNGVFDQAFGLIRTATVVQLIESTSAVDFGVVPPQGNRPPVAFDVLVNGFEDTDVRFALDAFDPDNDPLTYRVLSLPDTLTEGRLFQAPINMGDPLVPINTIPAIVTHPNAELIFRPALNRNGFPLAMFIYDANDGQANSNIATVTINIEPVNDAPLLNCRISADPEIDGTITPFPPILEDTPPDMNPGMSVATLINGFLKDVDENPLRGITIVSRDNAFGVWQYRLSIADPWINIPALIGANELLLPEEAIIRYLPNPNTNSNSPVFPLPPPSRPFIVVRGWDQTEGVAGQLFPVGATGIIDPTGAFSAQTCRSFQEVIPVNDPPEFAASDHTSLEDQGPITVLDWATVVRFGPPDEDRKQDVAEYIVETISNQSLFLVLPAVDIDGTLTYTAAPDAFGTAQISVRLRDNGGTANGGIDLSEKGTFNITVLPVNDPPDFAASNQTVLEDAGPQTVSNWATVLFFGPPNESDQMVEEYIVELVSGGEFLSAGPNVSVNGTLTYTPAPDEFGVVTFNVTLRDNGGTANGGIDLSPTRQFTITILPVNDPPTFVASNVISLEDDGPIEILGWSSFSPGPPNESGQSILGYTILNVVQNPPTLLISGPTVDNDGTLRFQSAPDEFGTVTFDMFVRDNGGTENGGNDTSVTQTFTITVLPVNDPPSFAASNQIIDQDSGPQTVPNWATVINFGPPNESDQMVAEFIVNILSGADLLTSGPNVDVNGTLTYLTAPGAFGVVTFDVTLRDNGGTANGGIDLSETLVFTITINEVELPPSLDCLSTGILLDSTSVCDVTVTAQRLINAGAVSIINGDINDFDVFLSNSGPFPIGTTNITVFANSGSLMLSCVVPVTVIGIDCNNNGIPDACELIQGSPDFNDCNNNGIPDDCEDLLDCDGNGIPDECECDNPADLIDGIASEVGTGGFESRAADDFFLEKAFIHKLNCVTADVLATSANPTASLEIYADCNGKPGELLYKTESSFFISRNQNLFGNFPLYRVVFNDLDLWLDGGRYWAAVVIVGDGTMTDRGFFATAGNGRIQGLPAFMKSPGFGHPDWTRIDLCRPDLGKTDLALNTFSERYECLWNNGKPIRESVCKSHNLATGQAHVADDFLVLPCLPDLETNVHFIRTYVLANVYPRIDFILYNNEDCLPDEQIMRFQSTRTILREPGFVDGLDLYEIQYCGTPFTLQDRQSYWLSIAQRGQSPASEIVLWPYGARCDLAPCDKWQLNPSHWRPKPFEPWTPLENCALVLSSGPGDDDEDQAGRGSSVNGQSPSIYKRDHPFLIAGLQGRNLRSIPGPAIAPPQQDCEKVDLDGDGQVTISDYFRFLTEFLGRLGG